MKLSLFFELDRTDKLVPGLHSLELRIGQKKSFEGSCVNDLFRYLMFWHFPKFDLVVKKGQGQPRSLFEQSW